jgi:mitochondrial fission protein ELM1
VLCVADATEAEERPLQIWALLGARAGDNDQVIALAEAIGLPFEVKQLEYNRLHALGPRLLGTSLASLTPASRRAILGDELPDLTISTGHRSVPAVRELRRRSGGRTRSIHVGFPRVSPDHFDLVIATSQYPIADHPKLLRIPYALTRAATEHANAAELAGFPEPRRLLLIGGPTLFWELDSAAVMRTVKRMIEEAFREGGSVLVSTSPRTPASLSEQLSSILKNSDVPTVLAQPGHKPRYGSLLAAADSIRVTADSVAMVSDAIWTGKPVATVAISKSRLGRMVFELNDRFRGGSAVYPQDLHFFWRALAEIGVGEQLATPRTSTAELMAAIQARVAPIVAAKRAGVLTR